MATLRRSTRNKTVLPETTNTEKVTKTKTITKTIKDSQPELVPSKLIHKITATKKAPVTKSTKKPTAKTKPMTDPKKSTTSAKSLKTGGSSVCDDVEEDKRLKKAQEEFKLALEKQRECRELKSMFDLSDLKKLKKDYKSACDSAKRDMQKLHQEQETKKTAGKTRSGVKRGVVKRPIYTDGKWVLKGMDDALEMFREDEVEFLKGKISKIDQVENLNFDQLKYLILHVISPDLKEVRAGNIDSYFHKRYQDLIGKSKQELRSEIRLSLFTCDQQAYINGLLAGAFDLGSKNSAGDIKHEEMDYVELVMFAEATLRIIKMIHKFKTVKEAQRYAVKMSRQSMGIEDDGGDEGDDDDDGDI